jgi:hypothetical protein
MPSGGIASDRPLMDRLADAQLDILRRVSSGETTLNPRRSENVDETIEHVEALGRRGMLTFDPRIEVGHPGRLRYSSITSLAVTDDGRRWLTQQQTATR